jgi:hypothetical protein
MKKRMRITKKKMFSKIVKESPNTNSRGVALLSLHPLKIYERSRIS